MSDIPNIPWLSNYFIRICDKDATFKMFVSEGMCLQFGGNDADNKCRDFESLITWAQIKQLHEETGALLARLKPERSEGLVPNHWAGGNDWGDGKSHRGWSCPEIHKDSPEATCEICEFSNNAGDEKVCRVHHRILQDMPECIFTPCDYFLGFKTQPEANAEEKSE